MNVFIGFVFDAYYVETELAEKGENDYRNLRLGVHGNNIEVELSDRFQQVMDHMLGGESLRQLSVEEGRRRKRERRLLESRSSVLAEEVKSLR